LDGVLKSWAVPKGPSLDPAEKRLAVHVEDHPIEYGDFEGVIPKGEYGGGTVMLWDEGIWEAEGDPHEGYRTGRLKFRLQGEKLRGLWALIRIRGSEGKDGKENWLLIKVKDEESGSKEDVLETLPLSVATRRSMDQIAEGGEASSHKPKPNDRIAGVKLSHPDRILYPDIGLSKAELAAYYETVGPRMLPFIAGRPLSLLRCPGGRQRACFFQKHVDQSLPSGTHAVAIEESGNEVENYLVVDSLSGLVSLVQLGVLELHPWGSSEKDLEKPTEMIFDIDPGQDVPWEAVIRTAKLLRNRLAVLGLESFVKTSGGKGLHVYVPIFPDRTWEGVKGFARAVAEEIARQDPKQYVLVMTKKKRKGRIFIDHLRNGRGATCVAPYSTRAGSNAPVSTPLFWEELSALEAADVFTVENLEQRLSELDADPWADFREKSRSITDEMFRDIGLPDAATQ
jgi:bifunctional non-homologous end joining protein LigD